MKGIAGIGISAADRFAASRDMLERCREAQGRTRGRLAFGWLTALVLYGVDPPRHHGLTMDKLYATARSDAERVKVRGVKSLVWSQPYVVEEFDGITVVDPLTACMQMMGYVDSREEAAVLCEAFMRRGNPVCPTLPRDMEEFLHTSGKFRGKAYAKWALPRVVPNTDSPMETRLRMAIMTGGLPSPVVNYPYRDETTGALHYLDAAYPDLRIDLEYMGNEWHTGMANDADSARTIALQRDLWVVMPITNARLSTEAERRRLIEAIREIREQQRRRFAL